MSTWYNEHVVQKVLKDSEYFGAILWRYLVVPILLCRCSPWRPPTAACCCRRSTVLTNLQKRESSWTTLEGLGERNWPHR